jgi:nijmegen breakage syndrome protein 1
MWAVRDPASGTTLALLPVPGHVSAYTVGRHESVDVLVPGDKSVSRKHLELTVDGAGSLQLTDLGSKFGTCVDGVRLAANASAVLAHGAEVSVGAKTAGLKWRQPSMRPPPHGPP